MEFLEPCPCLPLTNWPGSHPPDRSFSTGNTWMMSPDTLKAVRKLMSRKTFWKLECALQIQNLQLLNISISRQTFDETVNCLFSWHYPLNLGISKVGVEQILIKVFLVLLHFALSCFTDIVVSSTSSEDSPPAKRLWFIEGSDDG